ncbi:MAG: hypothetical protein JWP89_2493 [Schlesneria sp.]|nr:hypothetical protein [Schlesneria sp.]
MARIFYSMAGEGRGHAVRVRTLVEHLRHEHELVLFAPDEAYDFLVKSYGDECSVENVRLLRIPGIKFHYTGGKLDLFKSIGHGLNYARRELPTLVNAFRRRIEAEQPDLCISDFEPSLPRAARKAGVPLMSIDHQHVLLAYDLKTLPLLLRRYAWWMSWSIRYYYGSGPYQAVTSSFYTPPLKAGFENVQQVGPMLREDLVATVPQQGDFLLSYLRMNTPRRVLETLAACDWDVRVYGLGERPRQGRITFHAIDESRFVNDLASCAALVSAAENQLLGEALYLGKPVFAIPEEMHHEQQINACFLKQMGAGNWCVLEAFALDPLQKFLRQLDIYRANTAVLCGRLNGTPDALAAIRTMLTRHGRVDRSLVPERS